MLDAGRIWLLQRLLQVADDDLHRAFTATWSTARLRTLLVQACLSDGHHVVEPVVPGAPARLNHARRGAPTADFQAIRHEGARPLAVDLLTGAAAVTGGSTSNTSLSLASVHRALERVSSGAIDAVLISADAQAYERLFAPVDGRTAGRQRHAVAAVLPRAARFAFAKAHTSILGDVTFATVGRDVRAFGLERVACAVYVAPY